MKATMHLFMTLCVIFTASWAFCSEDTLDLSEIKHNWANAKYHLRGDAQHQALGHLVKRLESLHEAHPQSSEVTLWYGVVLSTYATTDSGLSALKSVNQAKKMLESVIATNSGLERGLAYGVLGTLYHKVPKWPVGFRDQNKARKYLEQNVSMYPESIDANFYYADFLKSQKDYQAAEKYYQAGLQASKRPGYELADEGRRKEITQSLAEIRQKTRAG